jgi:uncharacterized protein (DUF2344 family)
MPRKVVRVVTPGTVLEPELLPGDANNYLAAVVMEPTRHVDPEAWFDPIARNLPPGFAIKALVEVPLKLPAMQASLRAAVYRVCWEDVPEEELAERVQAVLAADEILRPRFKKP